MLFDGIKLVEGSEVQNLVVDSGSSFPASPNEGELFYRNDGGNESLYVYDGASWVKMINSGDSFSALLPDIGTPGTYKSVTVNAKGLVTAGSNPTTLTAYGITDAQPLDADLTAISVISANSGLLKKTAANTWSLDTNTYITGNETITLSGDMTGSGNTAITATLSTTGVAAGSYGTSTSVPTVLIDSRGRISSASNTSIAIDTSAIVSGTFSAARISQASVTQHQAALSISESQIADGSLLARNAGDESISGNWTFNTPVIGTSPTLDAHLTTKLYVDSIAAGVNPHASVVVATTANITLSGLQTIDSISVTAGNRVLVKNQTTGSQNGVYVADTGSWVRSSDFDGSPVNEVETGDLVFVESGTSNGSSSWIIITQGTIAVGSSDIQFSLFSRAGDFVGGAGLVKSGNTFDVVSASSSRIVVNVDNIDLATSGVTAGTYTKLTVDSYGRATVGASLVSSDVTTALGFTPYNATNPAGYITSAGSISTATNLAGGAIGSIPYQSASGTTLMLASSTAGFVLTSNGAAAPSWQAPVSTAAAGTLTGTTLAANVVSSSLTSIGTLTGLTINGIVLSPAVTGATVGIDTSIKGGASVSGTAGRVLLTGGNATTAAGGGDIFGVGGTGPAAGGNVTFNGGQATSITGTPGVITLQAGPQLNAGSAQLPGYVSILGGFTNVAGLKAGPVFFSGGQSAASDGIGGDAKINGGLGGSAGSGGSIIISTAPTNTLVERFRILNNGAWSVGSAGTNTGTTGQFLASTGATTPPAWTTSLAIANGGTGQTTAEAAIDALGGAAINPATPKDGDIQISAGPVISIYATGAYRQIFPAVYS
jgi:hypothetical protein